MANSVWEEHPSHRIKRLSGEWTVYRLKNEWRGFRLPPPAGARSTAMGIAPYRRGYQRARPSGGVPAAGYLPNPACHWTDHGADPHPDDLAWCIRHSWRVIYYSARQAAGLPLWSGVDDFEVLMTDVLFRLSSAFKPIPPIGCSEVAM